MEPKRLLHWYVLGTKATPPPDIFKQRLCARIGREFNLKVFVETGTYKGDMTAAAARVFDQVYSIELHKPFFDKAVARFNNEPRIKIINGDSGVELSKLLNTINQPALFWLDAHGGAASHNETGEDGPAPLVAEIAAILNDSKTDQHVILVDDVHTFVRNVKWGIGVWKQLEVQRDQWLGAHPDWAWRVEDNVLRIYKKDRATDLV